MPCPRSPAAAGALLLVFAAASALPASASAEVRRCTRTDGSTLYTDRSCESLGAVDGRPLSIGPGTAARAPTRYRGGCARNLDDLVFEVGAAIDAQDTNRLARSYHWTGLSTRTGYAVIDRLDAIARRPLADIVLVRPSPVVASTAATVRATAGSTPLDIGGVAAGGMTMTAVEPPPPRAPAPEALRIEQTLGDGITSSTTVFGLRRHMDCWWITL